MGLEVEVYTACVVAAFQVTAENLSKTKTSWCPLFDAAIVLSTGYDCIRRGLRYIAVKNRGFLGALDFGGPKPRPKRTFEKIGLRLTL